MGAWAWDQSGEPGDDVEGVEDDVSGPVMETVFESVHDLSPRSLTERHSLESAGRAM